MSGRRHKRTNEEGSDDEGPCECLGCRTPNFPKQAARRPKDNKKAISLRTEGKEIAANESTENLLKAVKLFNQSICYAKDPKDVTIGFAGRSMVYYKLKLYDECLKSIGFARKDSNMSAAIKFAVDQYEARCLEEMAIENPIMKISDPLVAKITFQPHATVPYIAKCLELRQSKKVGRHIVTTMDLKVGDIVAVEEALSIVTCNRQYDVCENCCQEFCENLIPCPKCTSVMFCSDKCYNEAFNRFHKYECVAVDQILGGLDPRARITLRLILRALAEYGSVDAFLDATAEAMTQTRTVFDIDNSKWTEKYAAVASLPKAEKAVVDRINMSHMQSVCFKIFEEFKMTSDKDIDECQSLLQKIIKQHFAMVQSNFHVLNCERDMKELYLYKVGAGIFPFLSLIGHSCDPNVEFTATNGTQQIVSVLKPIKAGEKLQIATR